MIIWLEVGFAVVNLLFSGIDYNILNNGNIKPEALPKWFGLIRTLTGT